MIKSTYLKVLISSVVIVLLFLLLSPFILKTWLTKQLKVPFQIDEYTLTAKDFSFTSLFSMNATQFTLEGNGILLTIDTPRATINPLALGFGRKPFITAHTGNGLLQITPGDSTGEPTPFPEFTIPVHCKVHVPFFRIIHTKDTVSIGPTVAENLNTRSLIAQSDSVKVHNRFYGEKIDAQMTWNDEHVVRYVASFELDSSYVHARATNPKSDVMQYSIESNGEIPKLSVLYAMVPDLKEYIPEELSILNTVNYEAAITINAESLELHGDVTASLQSEAVWPAPQITWKSTAALHNDTVQFHVFGTGTRGEKINIDGTVKGPDLNIKATTKNTTIELGSLIQTMDSPSILFSGTIPTNKYEFSILTPAHSLLSGTMIFDESNNPDIKFQATVNPSEPWALAWTEDNIRIRPSHISGHFFNEAANITVKTSSPFTYNTIADKMMCSFTIDIDGLEFYDSYFWAHGQQYLFDGEVSWIDYEEFVKVNVDVVGDGSAKFYSDFDGNFSINTSELEVKNIPLKDTSLLAPYDGRLTGNWSSIADDTTGNAILLYQTIVNGTPLYVSSKLDMVGDTIDILQLTVTHDINSMTANGSVLNRDNSYQDFSLLDLHLQVDNFDLAIFAGAFADSILSNGSLKSDLTYSKEYGVEGYVRIHDVSFKGRNSKELSLPRITIDAMQDKMQLSARLNMGEVNQWDSEVAVDISNLFKDTKNISMAVVPDNGGLFVINGSINKKKRISGDFLIEGPWDLPYNSGHLLNTNMKGSFDAQQKDGRYIPTLTSINNTGVYTHNREYEFPFTFDLSMNDTLISIPNFDISNQFQETIHLDLLGNTHNPKFLEELKFFTRNFNYPIAKNHFVKFVDLKAKLFPNDDALKFSIKSAEIEYFFKDLNYGTTRGIFKNSLLSYSIPNNNDSVLTDQNQKIEGSTSINTLIYDKNDFPEIDIFEFISIQRFVEAMAAQQTEVQSSNPIDLDITIQDDNSDSLWVLTNYPTFPFTVNLAVRGNTQTPLLSGDITSTDNGTLNLLDANYDITSFEAKWNNQQIKQGIVTFDFNKYFDRCLANKDEIKELSAEEQCNVAMSLKGPMSSLKLSHTTSEECNEIEKENSSSTDANGNTSQGEFDASSILATMVADCASSFSSFKSSNAKNIAINKIGKETVKWLQQQFGITSTTVDLDYTDDNYSGTITYTPTDDEDLSLYLGMTVYSDENTNDDKNPEQRFGSNYLLPILDNSSTYTKGSPSKGKLSLDAEVNWGGDTKTDGETSGESMYNLADDYRLSIGTSYSYRFWTLCLWGLGNCED